MTCHACHRPAKHLFYFTLLCGCYQGTCEHGVCWQCTKRWGKGLELVDGELVEVE